MAPARRSREDPDDAAALEAWNRYLAELHAADAVAQDPRTGRPTSPG